MGEKFIVRLRGSSYTNPDGSKRQELVAKLRRGESLLLRAEPNNARDRHAVAVLNSEGAQLGFLPSDARDSSALLRGEPVSAKVKKVIGGQRWWHKLFRIERHFGLLIELTKGPIDWTAHSKHRDIAEKVDELVKAALEFEKSSESVAASIEMYQKAMAAVIQLNSSNPVAAAHRYAQAPINRLTMLLVKEKKFSYAIEAYDQWRAVIDPVGITRTDSKALTKRIAKAKEKSET